MPAKAIFPAKVKFTGSRDQNMDISPGGGGEPFDALSLLTYIMKVRDGLSVICINLVINVLLWAHLEKSFYSSLKSSLTFQVTPAKRYLYLF